MTTTLYSYSGSQQEDAKRTIPVKEVHQLVELVETHEVTVTDGIPDRLTVRGTGNALGTQALGKGTVVEMHGLPNRIVVDAKTPILHDAGAAVTWPTVETTGWTTWESVLRACLRLKAPKKWGKHWDVPGRKARRSGESRHRCSWTTTTHPYPVLMPYVVPSSGRITIGGGIAGDTMWRYSSLVGKESRSVLWLDLLAYDSGTANQGRRAHTLRLLNPDIGDFPAMRERHAASAFDDLGLPDLRFAADRDKNRFLFNAVIGGHGLAGPVVRVKYLLLTLKKNYDHSNFELVKPDVYSAPATTRADEEEWRKLVEEMDREFADPSNKGRAGRWYRSDPHAWPKYPHAKKRDIKRGIGGKLKAKNLTWMFAVDQKRDLFRLLVEHHFDFKRSLPVTVPLPKEVNKKMVAAFGLFFPMSGQLLIGNLAYGTRKGPKHALPILRRRSIWKNLGIVVRLTPDRAREAEQHALNLVFNPLVRRSAGREPKPAVNKIPDFALFMEGHTIGLQRKPVPALRTVQQTWVIPLTRDNHVRAESSFELLLEALRTACSKDPSEGGIAIQSCDIKVIPASHALLSSAPAGPACEAVVAVTVGIENGAGYGPGALRSALTGVSDTVSGNGVRVHLTKNVYASKDRLKEMYGSQLTKFLEAKDILDPQGLYSSKFLEETLNFS